MPEIIAAAVGVPLTFVLGWWGRGKWERYPWNAKPKLWVAPPPGTTSAEVLRAGPVGQFERQVAERTERFREAWQSAFDLALKMRDDSVIVKLSDGEIQVPEDCPVPDEMLRAMNATPSFLAPEYRKAADDA